MLDALAPAWTDWVGGFTSQGRLFHLKGEGPLRDLLVEAWCHRGGLNRVDEWHVHALSLQPDLDLQDMTGREVLLQVRRADGELKEHAAVVTRAIALDSDGGFSRYRLEAQSWLGLLAHHRRSQVWQDLGVMEVIDSVLSAHAAIGEWRWAADVPDHLQLSPFGAEREYIVQYRESDLAFVQRVLAEEGLIYRFERHPGSPRGHRLVILADSPNEDSCPEDPSSASALGGRGLRFHRAAIDEPMDTIQAFGGRRQFHASTATVLAHDPDWRRSTTATLPTQGAVGGENAPRLEHYDPLPLRTFVTAAQADRAALLHMQALESREKAWLGYGTVRTLSAGTTFHLTQSTLDALQAALRETGGTLGLGAPVDPHRRHRFLVTEVIEAGLNNLPKGLGDALAGPQAAQRRQASLMPGWVDAPMRRQLVQSGYANHFVCTRADVPWRPPVRGVDGLHLHPRPTAPSFLEALVVGPEGRTGGSGPGEIHTDAQGRIRVQLDLQTQPAMGPSTTRASLWVRVAQPQSGSSMGLHFTPRIGQNVLLAFHEGDIDHPVVVAALYDGRGDGGVTPTPGGQPAEVPASPFSASGDHVPSGQANLSGGHAPVWHGASPEPAVPQGGQANAAALSGWRTQEFAGIGFNQLVFDDSPQQLRVQLASTQHGTQLHLGHLIHAADNHRGTFRGTGFECRTDAQGVLRARGGLLLSTHTARPDQPAGHIDASLALSRQLLALAERLDPLTTPARHDTVRLSAHLGTLRPDRSAIDDTHAPLKAQHRALSTVVSDRDPDAALTDAEARSQPSDADDPKLPHPGAPLLHLAGAGGIALGASADLALAAEETVHLAAGQHQHWATAQNLRLHTAQSLGVLGGAMDPTLGPSGSGLEFIAAQKNTTIQAQDGTFELGARKALLVESTESRVDVASPRLISLSTPGGANITIANGSIVVQCPGTITVLSARRSFLPPAFVSVALQELPRADVRFDQEFVLYLDNGEPIANRRFEIHFSDGGVQKGTTDSLGRTGLKKAQFPSRYRIRVLPPQSS